MGQRRRKLDLRVRQRFGRARRRSTISGWVMLGLLLFLLFFAGHGCATYSDHTERARQLAQQGDYDGALVAIDKLLGVEDSHTQPNRFGKDTALVLLERGMLHQARGDHDGSRKDLEAADKELEILDFTNTLATDVARYLYSDSASPYKISPVERLSLNAINILNYLAIGDLRGARVEAKRFTVMRKFMQDLDPDHAHAAIGSYLAGFVYERLGEGGAAMRHYDEALAEAHFESLVDPVARLSERVSYRGKNIDRLLDHVSPSSASGGGEILVVAGVGRVPFKTPKRMPIGAAIGIMSADVTGDLDVLERSAFKVLIFPELVPAIGTYHSAQTTIDGEPVPMDQVTNLGAELVREYEEIKPRIIAAAVSRMISRAVVAEGARAAGKQAGGGDGALLGALASFIGEGLLVAADRPDTRSWTLLPEKVFASRKRVAAGSHEVRVGLGPGEVWQSVPVEVPEGGYAIVVVMPLH